jgi:hypothetical protein
MMMQEAVKGTLTQNSQIKNTTAQQATKQQMPFERMTAIREVQADILSTLKDTSYFINDTTRAHINSFHVDTFNRLKNIVRQRDIRACIDGQILAP